MSIDKLGVAYWNSIYDPDNISAFEPDTPGVRGFARRSWHRLYSSAFSKIIRSDKQLIEMGCGGSQMLPYFAKHFRFSVAGLDYAESGCHLAKEILASSGITSEVVCCDFFNPPEGWLQRFDVVYSQGVIEHFPDTAECIRAFAQYLQPGGMMFTIIPNMNGLPGVLSRALNRSVDEGHVPLSIEELGAAHADAGLKVQICKYFQFVNFGVLHLEGVQGGSIAQVAKRILLFGLRALTALVWTVELAVRRLPENSLTSPYLVCIATKPSC